ncbi:MAG: glutathione S-transferase domain-containing protein [Thermoleophilia bacterium]|nr:glutathione S-transferase domain-containing protein [Thermoleophilia bacterium]
MGLYTCEQKKSTPRFHPCGKAAKALDDAGHEYEIEAVGGYRMLPWTWPKRSRDRAVIKELSGQENVPILVLDDGEVISGSGTIADWAEANPASD